MTHEHTPPETGCTPEEQSAWHAGKQEKCIKELEKDALRYRWLRTRWGRLDELYEGDTMVSMRELVGDAVSMRGFNVEPDTLDACIDKVMEASK